MLRTTDNMRVEDILHYNTKRRFTITEIVSDTQVGVKEIGGYEIVVDNVSVSAFSKWVSVKIDNWKNRIQSDGSSSKVRK